MLEEPKRKGRNFGAIMAAKRAAAQAPHIAKQHEQRVKALRSKRPRRSAPRTMKHLLDL